MTTNVTAQRRSKHKHILRWTGVLLIAIMLVCSILVAIRYNRDVRRAYARLDSLRANTFDSSFGTMSYLVKGTGEAILISHGIFGGYDQGMSSLDQLVGDRYHKISISRFGYPGSAMPSDPTPLHQAEVFKELLDHLGINRAYILTTSAGGAAGIRFALEYPERVKGLILLSSAVPDRPRTPDQIKELGMTGPPEAIINDFPMWFSMTYFSVALNTMMGSQADTSTLYETMLPVSPRKEGIAADTAITNIDMTLHYAAYPVERITAPILVVHAKDDPMTKCSNTELFLDRVHAQTRIFDTGGHLISGHGDAVGAAIREFIS